MERSPSDSAARAAEVYLRTKWHPFIWSFLSSDFPYDAVNLGRELIDKEDYMMPTTSQAGVLHHLGKYGGEEDIGRLRSGLASTEPKIRSASVRALGDLGFSSIEESIWPLLEDPYTSVVQAAISALKQIAAPLAKTVTLLFERSGEDPNPETMDLAGQAIETLLRKHLNSDPFENVETWLTILTAFGRSDCATQLETILYELEDNPTLRAKVATTIGACCEPEAGLALITRRLNEEPVERNREVKYALNAAADQLSGSPDLAILRLISEVVEVELDRDELLGSYSFNQLFSIPNTVSYLRSGLPKVLKEKDNPDAFITRLDGISSILANEVEDALIRQYPSSATTNGRRRGFAAQIDFMGRVNPELKAAAVALHGIRQKSDLPHVEDETSGRPKPGCDAVDMEDAKRHFLVVFRETVKYLKQDYATHRSS
ncbi:hypothetical protein GTO27_03810 [Candidatus Bathyarchaeota archaeon]|nr:hypothetical protein [Candidatus Bathyarchaeota archaeon]